MPPRDEAARWRALLHRWFVEYNPLYLASATLVLFGGTVVSREVAQHGVQYGGVAVGALTELYACALIAGAACLTRMGLRRPAALLALLAVLHQCDLTLQVETYVWYGGVGVPASTVWLGLFVAKLRALAWALRLRLSRSALVVPTIGAVGLAVLPQLLRELDPRAGSLLVAAWVFGLAVGGAWTDRVVTSADGFDVRGLRAVRGTWALWSAALLAHVVFWATEPDLDLDLVPLVPALALAGTRWLRRERTVWALGGAMLLGVAVVEPSSLALVAIMVAVIFALHAWRRPLLVAPESHTVLAPSPYRVPELGALVVTTPVSSFGRSSPEAIRRYLVGVASALYLAVWTQGWTGGPAPEHLLALDVVFVLGCAAYAWRARAWLALAPLAIVPTHFAAQRAWISVPSTALEIGGAALGLGFIFLAMGLAITWRLERTECSISPTAGPRSPLDVGRRAA